MEFNITGSEGGLGKRTWSNPGTAPQADPTIPRTAYPPLLDARRCMVGHDDVDDICDVRPRVRPPADSRPDGTMIFRATDFDFDISRMRPSPAGSCQCLTVPSDARAYCGFAHPVEFAHP